MKEQARSIKHFCSAKAKAAYSFACSKKAMMRTAKRHTKLDLVERCCLSKQWL